MDIVRKTYKQSSERAEGDVNLSPRRQAWTKRHIDESTAQILAEDERYFLHQSLSTPCLNVIRESKGIYLQDMQGRQIMDFHGNSVHQVGHGNTRVIEMIKKQLDEIPFCPRRYTNQVAIDLARRLVELAPGNLNKLLFTPGGTSAIGMALKLTQQQGRLAALGQTLVGFGLFFIGIGVLKDAFDGVMQSFPISQFVAEGVGGILTYLLVGIIITVLTQSSSASIALTITAAGSGMIEMYSAGAMVIGANIGTTITAIFANGIVCEKRFIAKSESDTMNRMAPTNTH